MHLTSEEMTEIRALLERMQQIDTTYRVFGVQYHQYRLGPPLPESDLLAFEQRYGITLPPDYRAFLQYLGDGGAERSTKPVSVINAGPGPGYGLLPLEETLADCDPTRPFPYTEEVSMQVIHAADDNPYDTLIPGVLVICDKGCTYYSALVVHGPAYGTIWEGNYDFNLYPTGLSFTEWYCRWTDMLQNRAIPTLAQEKVVERVQVGMTREEVTAICGGEATVRSITDTWRFLRFNHLVTQFELDSEDRVSRIVNHSIS